MAVLTGYEEMKNAEPRYIDGVKYIEVTKDDYHYLINEENHEIKISN